MYVAARLRGLVDVVLGCRAQRGDPAAVGSGGAAHGPAGGTAHRVLERDGRGGLDVVEPLDVVLFGRGVAAAFLGQHVDDDRAVPLGGVCEGLLHVLDVMAVDRPGVTHAQRLEEGVRRHHVAQRAGQRVHARVGQLAQGGQLAQAQAQSLAGRRIGRVEPQRRETLGELRDRRRVGATVVVEDDHHAAMRVPEVVQGLVGHAPGQGAVADDGHHLALPVDPPQREAAGDPVGVGEAGRRVAVLDPVVLGLGPVGISGHAARLLQRLEAVAAAGEQLVHVGLVAGVPQDDVAGRVEDTVQRQCELDRPEVGAEMPPGRRDRLDDERPDLIAEFDELLVAQLLQIGGRLDAGQDHGEAPGYPLVSAPALRCGVSRVQAATPKAARAKTWRPRAGPRFCEIHPTIGAPATQPT